MAQLNIHPKYFETKITCITCSNQFISGSTKNTEIRVDTCSNCHPFYTGKQSFVSAKGRVEKFLNKSSKKIELNSEKKKTKAKPEQNNSKGVSLDSFKLEEKKAK